MRSELHSEKEKRRDELRRYYIRNFYYQHDDERISDAACMAFIRGYEYAMHMLEAAGRSEDEN